MPDIPTPTSASLTSADPSNPFADPLMTIVIAFLTPMFLWAGDVALARAAAIQALGAYSLASNRNLVTMAKIIAFELASLCSLSQSMAEDISIPLALRLRGNANSMDRAAERNRRMLENDERAAALAVKAAHITEEAAAAAVAEAREAVHTAKLRIQAAPAPLPPAPVPLASARQPAPQIRTPTVEQQWRTAWAEAMTDVAAEFTVGLDSLPPAERAAEMSRIQALTEAARTLASGAPLDNPFGTRTTFADSPALAGGR
jgi:hypothetical protein